MSINQQKEFNGVAIVMDKKEARVSHFEIARVLDIQAKSTLQLITDYEADFNELGVLRFENAKPLKGTSDGRPERIAYLNEDQSFLLLSYSRNTEKVRCAKVRMVKAFKAARDALALHETQYLPMHHALHDKQHLIALKAKADGSKTAESVFHMNGEKLINRVFGFDAGTRSTLSVGQKAAVSMAYSIYANCCDHVLNQGLPANDAYALAKPRIEQLAGIMDIQQLGAAW